MKEAIIYSIIACTSLFLTGYVVHMFIGGLVSERTEKLAMIVVVSIAATVYAFLAWDVIKRRRAQGR